MPVQLVTLPEVERLSSACIRILGGNPGKFTLQGTNTYLVGTGNRRLLIDTGDGCPSWIAALKRTLAEEKAVVDSVLITHWHHDHTNGIPQVRELYPRATVYKHDADDSQAEISEGQTFTVEGASLVAAHTPGHTEDHMVFHFQEEDALFAGDNVLGHGTAVFEDLSTYLASLDRMKGIFRGRAYPGHGAVVEDGPGKILEYIRHRKTRETQVLEVLNSRKPGADGPGAWSVMELVKIIYKDVPEELHEPASGGVMQILRKLESDGRVSCDRSLWKL
ncbi:probable metallo-beta-lactamase domain protein [Cephalotrichum gorgonifer]|uniref:Probable metallo-beta-lactamase domain protein n=1 Tax=Cephalotrichum gorgonifer TaxID=2041049 RepID=A0AAE8SYJ5_9PEZI|nr:probable metallo-beta-lactamase domain protein [Cephalotrichum gorgonifer]